MHRERSATTDGASPDLSGPEPPRPRAATVDTIKASRSMISRAGTSFSVPVREVFTVVTEEESYGQPAEDSSYQEEGITGAQGGGFGGVEESVSPRRQPFLGQDGFSNSSAEKDESEGRGQGVANIIAALKAGQG